MLTPAPPKSWFLNEKLYTKLLVSKEDQEPFSHCLVKILGTSSLYNVVGSSDSIKDKIHLAHALMHMLVLSSHSSIRRISLSLIQSLVVSSIKNEELAIRIIRIGRLGLGSILIQENARRLSGYVTSATISSSIVNTAIAPTVSNVANLSSESSLSAWGDDKIREAKDFSSRLYLALFSIIPSNSDSALSSYLTQSLMDLSILCSHPLIVSTAGSDIWIRLCIKAGYDPLELVEEKGEEIVKRWMDLVNAKELSSDFDHTLGGLWSSSSSSVSTVVSDINSITYFRDATLSAITLFTRVSPSILVDIVSPKVMNILADEKVQELRVIDVDIWKGQGGVLVDVKTITSGGSSSKAKAAASSVRISSLLANSGKPAANSKAALAAKAEKEAERVQLEKESEIRKKVSIIRDQIHASLDTLQAVIQGVVQASSMSVDPEEAAFAFQNWVYRWISTLQLVIARELKVVHKGSDVSKGAVLAGRKAVDVFRSISRAAAMVEDGRLMKMIQMGWDIATLRVIGIEEGGEEGIPEDMCKKVLEGIIDW